MSGSFISGTVNPSIISELHAHYCPDLTSLNVSSNPYLKTVDIINCTNLTSLTLNNNVSMSVVTMSNNTSLITMSFAYTQIPFFALNVLLPSIYSQSLALTSGSLNITGSDTGSINTGASASLSYLISKKWTIISGPNVPA
jgi:hypothetical protein